MLNKHTRIRKAKSTSQTVIPPAGQLFLYLCTLDTEGLLKREITDDPCPHCGYLLIRLSIRRTRQAVLIYCRGCHYGTWDPSFGRSQLSALLRSRRQSP